jgi:hypothetical protein
MMLWILNSGNENWGGLIWAGDTKSGIEDVSLLSQTDYIIGPPSTFNGWASFMGNIGRFWMTPDKMCPDSLDDFKVHFIED